MRGIVGRRWGRGDLDEHTIKVEYEPRKVGGGKYYAPLPNGAIVEFSHKQLRDETDRNLERNARAQIGARASS